MGQEASRSILKDRNHTRWQNESLPCFELHSLEPTCHVQFTTRWRSEAKVWIYCPMSHLWKKGKVFLFWFCKQTPMFPIGSSMSGHTEGPHNLTTCFQPVATETRLWKALKQDLEATPLFWSLSPNQLASGQFPLALIELLSSIKTCPLKKGGSYCKW